MLVTGMLGPSLSALLPASGRLPARTVLQVTAPRLQILGAQRGGEGEGEGGGRCRRAHRAAGGVERMRNQIQSVRQGRGLGFGERIGIGLEATGCVDKRREIG